MNQSTSKDQKYQELIALRIKLAQKKPWHFLKHFFFTKDEHDPSVMNKQFPAKAMHRILCRVWEENDVTFGIKSRQIMFTWTMAGLLLWDTMFRNNRLNFIQSKKEGDSAKVLDRARHAYNALLKKKFPGLPLAKRTGEKTGTTTRLTFPDQGSELEAIPQGEDIVRMNTCSNLLADEINHQSEGEKSYGAAKPTIDGGGHYFGAGTANGRNWVYRLMNNIDSKTLEVVGGNRVDSRTVGIKPFYPDPALSPEQQRHWIEDKIVSLSDAEFDSIPLADLMSCVPGMEYWVTHDGFKCISIHYTADPDKDPVTAKGAAWYKSYREGWKDEDWEREMEMSVDTFEGRPVIQNWNRNKFVRSLEYDPRLPLLMSVDFGAQVCCVFLAQLARIEGTTAKQLRFLSELVLRGLSANTPLMAKMLQEIVRTKYAESWESRNLRCFPDPAGHQRKETTADTSLDTSIKIMEANGFPCESKQIGIRESTDLVRDVFGVMYPGGETGIVMDPACGYLIGVCRGGWHYPDKDDGVHTGKPEKDGEWDHGGDILRHMVANTWDAEDFGVTKQQPDFIIKTTRNKYTGQVVRTRRVPTRGGRIYAGR